MVPRLEIQVLGERGAYFTSADDLASVSSDWIAGKRTRLDFVIDASQTTAWKTHLLGEGLSRHC